MQSPLAAKATQQALFIEQVPTHIAVFDTEMRYLAASHRFLSDMAFLFSIEVFAPARLLACSELPLRQLKLIGLTLFS
jgi:hypothetical protein